MIRNRDILNCLPLLASALADKYGVKVNIGGDRAYTNGKTIQIPALPMDCGKTALALAKGYLDHEAAHIRYTDLACFRQSAINPVVRHLCNSIEDWRVEKCLSERYPGCKTNLAWLVKHVFLEDAEKAGDENPAFSVLNYVLLTVRAWDVDELKIPLQHTRDVLEEAFPGLASALDKILNKVRLHCPDTKASLNYALELERIVRAYESQEEKSFQEKSDANQAQKEGDRDKSLDASGNKPESGDRARNESSDTDAQAEEKGNKSKQEEQKKAGKNRKEKDGSSATSTSSDSQEEMRESGQDEDGFKDKADDSDSEEYDLPKDNKRAALKSLFDKEAEDLPLGLGEIIERKLGENASGNPDDGFAVSACVNRQTERLQVDEKLLALKSSNALRQRLAGLLQARALKHIAPAKIGKLNTAKLYRLNIGNPRIFRKESSVSGVSSAVHILLDASYSMDNARIILARQACYSLAKALGEIKGINPAVTVFPTGFNDDVYPLLKHGEKLTDRFKVEARGGTPLAPALWWVGQTLYPLLESRKIILIITDGQPDNPAAVKRALDTLKKLGIEIYGIGIELDAIKEMLPDSSRIIRNLTELAPAMFGMLQDALLKGGRHDGSN